MDHLHSEGQGGICLRCCFRVSIRIVSNFEDDTIIAGSCGVNEVKVFRKHDGTYELTTKIQGLTNGCFSVDSSALHPNFVFTTAKDGMFIYGQHPN